MATDVQKATENLQETAENRQQQAPANQTPARKEALANAVRSVNIVTIIKWAVILFLFLIVTNPALIPFLSGDTKESLRNTWGNLFGDVSQIAGSISINWVSVFEVIAIILLMVLVTTVLKFILEHISPKTGKGRSAASLIRSALSYITALVGFFWCLAALGVNVSTIFAGVGLVALIVGFGAQSLVEDLVTGIFLVFEDEFNVGDIIEVNGFRGTVESIGIRTTSIREPGNNIKIINNADLRNILNRSAASSVAGTTVSIAYSESIERAEKVLEKVLPKIREKYPEVFLTDPRCVGVQELGASSVDLKIIGEVHDKDIYSAPRLLNREIKIAFDEAGIEIPFAQIVVHQAND